MSDESELIRQTLEVDAGLYDALSPSGQAFVRAIWSQRFDEAAATLDVAADKRAEDQPYATVDDDGRVAIVEADSDD